MIRATQPDRAFVEYLVGVIGPLAGGEFGPGWVGVRDDGQRTRPRFANQSPE